MKRIVRNDTVLIFLTLLLAYVYVLPRWADWSQTSRLNLVRALVERGTVRIDDYLRNTGDYALIDGHAYTDKAPGPSLMGLPVYLLVYPILQQPFINERLERLATGGALGGTLNPQGTGLNSDKVRDFVSQFLLTLTVIAFPSALAGVVLYQFLALFGAGRIPRLLTTLAYGLATPAATYAGNFYSHQLVGSLCLIAFALIAWLARGEGGWPRALLAGLLMGFVVISEYPAALTVAAIGIYAIVCVPRKVLWIVLGGALPVGLMVVYDMVAFGTPIPVGYSHSALWQNQHSTGFMSITYPHAEALWGLTFGDFRGLFVRAPWLVLSIPGLVLWWRSRTLRAEWFVTVCAASGITLFYSSSVMWWGGFAAGPRYIVPAIPFLAVAAFPAVVALWNLRQPTAALGARIGLVLLTIMAAIITWVEGTASQSFPVDTIRNTWDGYVFPAWQRGDIARNAGTLLGLHGGMTLLPLVITLTALIVWMVTRGRESDTPQPVPTSAAERSKRQVPADRF